jgi:hypothetical protein
VGAILLLALGGVLVSLLLGEGVLRLVGFSHPTWMERDPVRGWALRPGLEGWQTQEGRAHVRINSRGLRDREHLLEKPPGTYRIAVLGDSYAEAMQVAQEKTFWAVLEEGLATCPALAGRAVEALNFGVSGYGTAQELLTLRHHAWPYSPDLVLLAFLPSNDVSDNSRALGRDEAKPYFVLRGERLDLEPAYGGRNATLHESALGRAFRWGRDRLRLVQLVQRVRDIRREGAVRARLQGGATGGSGGGEPGLADAAYRPPAEPAWEDAWRVTQALISTMRREVEARGARFLVVTLTRAIQVHPERPVRERYMASAGLDGLLYPESRVAALGGREGFPVLLLAPPLLAHAEGTGTFLHGFGPNLGSGHWNEAGHELAGRLIAEEVCRLQ